MRNSNRILALSVLSFLGLILWFQAPSLQALNARSVTSFFPDHAPIGHTGGFGEPSCQACHFDNDLNDKKGRLRLEKKLRVEWEQRRIYEIDVILEHPEMKKSGFQLAIRHDDGSNAGEIRIVREHEMKLEQGFDQLMYLTHLAGGNTPEQLGKKSWSFEWISEEDVRTVWLYIAANAGNGDQSQFGDWVYVDSLRVEYPGQ